MIDLKECSFLIPTLIDSNDRLNNLLLIVKYLTTYFNTNILIGEQKNLKCVCLNLITNENTKCFQFDLGVEEYFKRSVIFNKLARIAKTKIIALYDVDVLLPIEQINCAYNLLMENKYDMVYPYDGKFCQVKKNDLPKISESLNLTDIDITKCDITNPNSLGGAIFLNRDIFIKGGMENEMFKGWGVEDLERCYRYEKLGFNQCRIKGPLYHFEHERGKSAFYPFDSEKGNIQVYMKEKQLTTEQLQQEIKNWQWVTHD